jgi:hypothetical protein
MTSAIHPAREFLFLRIDQRGKGGPFPYEGLFLFSKNRKKLEISFFWGL